jgi:hypothetical protein
MTNPSQRPAQPSSRPATPDRTKARPQASPIDGVMLSDGEGRNNAHTPAAMQRRQASGAGCWRRAELADLYRGRRRGEHLTGKVPGHGRPVWAGGSLRGDTVPGSGNGRRAPVSGPAIGLTRRVAALRPASHLSVWRPGQPANVSGSGAGEQVRVQAGDEFGQVLAAEGEVPVHGRPGAGLNVTTGRGVVAGAIGGYEQGGYILAVSCPAQFTSDVPALYAAAVAGG